MIGIYDFAKRMEPGPGFYIFYSLMNIRVFADEHCLNALKNGLTLDYKNQIEEHMPHALSHTPNSASISRAGFHLNQLRYDLNNLKIQLAILTDENIYLKNKLSGILKNNFREPLLEEIDSYQSLFIKEDERIRLIRNNLAEIDKGLDQELNVEKLPLQLAEKQLKNVRHNIKISKTQFGKLKSGFNHFILANHL